MFCRKCGKEIPDDSEFCPKCGTAIEKNISEQMNAQIATTAASASDASPVTYSASETQTSESVNVHQAVLVETKPGGTNKPLIITVTIAVIAAILAAIIIPIAVSQSNKAHSESDQNYQENDRNQNAVIPDKEFEIVLKDDDTYMISKYLSTDPNVTIPSEIDGKPVSEVGDRAFSGSSVESVTIGKNVWKIGRYAFSNCRSLRSAEILPNDDFVIDAVEGNILINSIGEGAFEGCSSLETFVFPYNNYSEIGPRAFYQCSALKSVELIAIMSVGEKAFFESGLRSVNLHSGETKPAVFANCKDLKEVTLGNLVDISDEMFSGCTSLETVNWNFSPYMDNEIGSKAFYGCSSLKRFNTIDTPITYPQGFSEFIEGFRELGAKDIVIGEDAFEGCWKFKDPEPVTPPQPAKKGIKDYTGAQLAEMTYKEFTDNFGMPAGGFFWGSALYPDSNGNIIAEVGFDFKGDWSGSGDGFNANSRNKLKYITIYGETETKINDEIHLGEGLDYYNKHLSFNVYDALKMGAGDHGAVWYEVSIKYSNRSSGKPLYTVDLMLTEGDYICYAAKITSLQ